MYFNFDPIMTILLGQDSKNQCIRWLFRKTMLLILQKFQLVYTISNSIAGKLFTYRIKNDHILSFQKFKYSQRAKDRW